jgi:hypothetical protein
VGMRHGTSSWCAHPPFAYHCVPKLPERGKTLFDPFNGTWIDLLVQTFSAPALSGPWMPSKPMFP